MAVNLNRETVIKSAISFDDYPNAAGMIQPYKGLWELPKEGILLYDSYNKIVKPLIEDFEFELKTREERLFQLSPIINGWSVIGNSDKYLSASTVEVKSIKKNEIICTMKALGSLTIWSNNGIPKINGVPFNSLRNHLYTFDCSTIETSNYIL